MVRIAKSRLGQVICWFALGTPLFGQVTEASLQALYGKPVAGTYTVRPGVTIATSDGPKGEACVLSIFGPTTEQEANAVIDEVVPAASRGLAGRTMVGCVGACESVRDYEKVTFSWAVMPGQIANPAAIIVFKNKNCEQRAKEVRARGFSITRPKSRTK